MPLSRYAPEHYNDLLQQKCDKVSLEFTGLQLPQPTTFASKPSHYRMRAEFRVGLIDGQMHYVVFAGKDKQRVFIDDFPIANEHINRLMTALKSAINASEPLRAKLYQVDFLTSSAGDAIISLIYHRKLDTQWQLHASELAKKLGVSVIGRSKGQRVVIGNDAIEEAFSVGGNTFRYVQPEGGFTQPNASVNRQMLHWAQEQGALCGGDLLELYCGIGNFTLPLSHCFNKVLATEVAKTSIAALDRNIALNDRRNIAHARLSSYEMSQALARVRPFKRLAHVTLDDYRFSTIFVDPPRAGLDDQTRNLCSSFQNILYVSCNPHTLHRDLQELTKTHDILSFAMFDQFPYTDHMECGVRLTRR